MEYTYSREIGDFQVKQGSPPVGRSIELSVESNPKNLPAVVEVISETESVYQVRAENSGHSALRYRIQSVWTGDEEKEITQVAVPEIVEDVVESVIKNEEPQDIQTEPVIDAELQSIIEEHIFLDGVDEE